MALISCKDCGTEVSTSATACPKCGAKVPKTKWWLWVPLALIVVLFLLPYTNSPAEREAISARADCEQVFPMERGSGCNRVYDDAYRRATQALQVPVGEAPVDRALVDAAAKKREAEDDTNRKECSEKIAARTADYKSLMAKREYWSASLALRRCSELLNEPALKALVAQAEIKQHVMEIESTSTTRVARNSAIEALMRDYPDVGKRYEKRLER